MRAYDELSIEELRRRGSIKWTAYGDDVLAAWVAEMDYRTAPAVRDALSAAVARDFVGSPPRDADSGLPEACAEWLATSSPRRLGLRVEPAQVRILPDVLKGVELAVDTFSRPGSAVVVTTPSYPPFFEVVRVCDRPLAEVPMTLDAGRYTLDLAGIDAALAAGAGVVVLCNPYNPLGRVFTPTELSALAEVVERHGARVVADEIHAPLTYPGARHTPYATVSPAAAAHSVTLVSASKAWNLPGLKCAEAVLTNPADVEAWDRLPKLRTHGASTLGIAAHIAAFRHGASWLEETVAHLDGNRRLLGELLRGLLPDVGYHLPEATYLAWLDCRGLGVADPAGLFLSRARVALNDGVTFGAPGRGFVRLNFATSRSILERLVKAMAQAVQAS